MVQYGAVRCSTVPLVMHVSEGTDGGGNEQASNDDVIMVLFVIRCCELVRDVMRTGTMMCAPELWWEHRKGGRKHNESVRIQFTLSKHTDIWVG